jgi:hypothetical protein
MTLLEFLIALMSIFFIFDSATIHIINIPFTILLIIYISSVIEIFVASIVYKKIKWWVKSDKY